MTDAQEIALNHPVTSEADIHLDRYRRIVPGGAGLFSVHVSVRLYGGQRHWHVAIGALTRNYEVIAIKQCSESWMRAALGVASRELEGVGEGVGCEMQVSAYCLRFRRALTRGELLRVGRGVVAAAASAATVPQPQIVGDFYEVQGVGRA